MRQKLSEETKQKVVATGFEKNPYIVKEEFCAHLYLRDATGILKEQIAETGDEWFSQLIWKKNYHEIYERWY